MGSRAMHELALIQELCALAQAAAEQQAAAALANPNVVQNMVQNPEMVQALVAAPAIQAILAAMVQQAVQNQNPANNQGNP